MGGVDGCHRLFEEVLAKGYGDWVYGAVHLLTVDSYALQHGDSHVPRSNAYHLVRLCALMEFGASPRIGSREPQGWQARLEGGREVPISRLANNAPAVTVLDVVGAENPKEHAERVWARSEWEAWQEWARGVLREL